MLTIKTLSKQLVHTVHYLNLTEQKSLLGKTIVILQYIIIYTIHPTLFSSCTSKIEGGVDTASGKQKCQPTELTPSVLLKTAHLRVQVTRTTDQFMNGR